jgi:Putative transposase
VAGFQAASPGFAALRVTRSIFWRSVAPREISAPAARPNALSCSQKNSSQRSWLPSRIVTLTFSIPRVLRGLIERDPRLLGLLSQTPYAAILKTFQAFFDRPDVRPGCVISLQTYGANFNPHAHALVSDGVLTPDGEFLPLPAPDPAAVMEVFRRLSLERLHRAERLSESFMHNLLSWVHPGFSVFAGPAVDGAALTSLDSQGRYITRPHSGHGCVGESR